MRDDVSLICAYTATKSLMLVTRCMTDKTIFYRRSGLD